MKKIISAFSVILCCMMLVTGCSGKETAGGVKMKDGQTVQTVTDQIINEVGIAMGMQLDDTVLKDMFYIDGADVEAYAGEMSLSMTSADNIVAVQAKEGKIDTVKQALEKRLADVRQSFEQYLPEQSEKAQKGQVVVKGNYAFLLILGEDSTTYDDDMKKANDIINEAF